MTDAVDQIASNLIREGINKHKARELAVHFIKLVGMPLNSWVDLSEQMPHCPYCEARMQPVNDSKEFCYWACDCEQLPDLSPAYPQRLSIADVDYANTEKPKTWNIEHFECWQREQVALENIRVLRRHIKELRRVMSPKPENDDTKSECVADADEIAIILAKEGLDTHRAIDVAAHIAGMFQLSEFEALVQRVQELERQACEIISREWVSLTEHEAAECWSSGSVKTWQAIEAKLKEKNAYGWQSVANPTEYLDDLRGEADEQEPIGEVVEAFAGLTAVSIPKMPPVGTKLYTQPAPPVAWTSRELEFIDEMIVVQLNHADRCDNIKNPVAEKQKQWDLERVAILRKAKGMSQREWQGLTDEEIHDEALKLMRQHKTGYMGIARAVEAMLKERNNA